MVNGAVKKLPFKNGNGHLNEMPLLFTVDQFYALVTGQEDAFYLLIDLIPVLRDLYMDEKEFLTPIKKVEVRYA